MARTYRATVKMHGTSDGVLMQPSWHYQTDVATGQSEPAPNDVADGIWSLISADWRSLTPTNVVIDELVVVEQVVPGDVPTAGVKTINLAGLASSYIGENPRELCPLFNLHTATRSRSARGWFHFASITASTLLNGGNWTSGFLASLGNIAAKMDDSFDLGVAFPTHVNPVVYSRKRHILGQTPYTFRVTSATVNPHPAWLRSRRRSP